MKVRSSTFVVARPGGRTRRHSAVAGGRELKSSARGGKLVEERKKSRGRKKGKRNEESGREGEKVDERKEKKKKGEKHPASGISLTSCAGNWFADHNE